MTLFMVAVALAATGVLWVGRLLRPARPDLLGSVARFDQARERATRLRHRADLDGHSKSGHQAPTTTLAGRLGTWLAEQAQRRGRDLTSVTRDLAVTGSTLEAHLSKALTLSAIGFLGPTAILTLLDTPALGGGLGLPLVLGPVAGLVLAGLMVVMARRELHETAARRRAEFRRTLSIYLDLVAMSMQAGRGHAEALPASAAIGNGWAFTHLQDTITGARFTGVTPWAALGDLGERLGVRELVDLQGALGLANDDGAKVRSTLLARAQTLRAQRLADAEANAAQSTESMKFALILMVFVFLTYELYPPVVRLFSG